MSELSGPDRSTALRRALLFIVATSAIWLVPKRFPVFHPIAMLGVVLGATLLFLWWDKRSPSVLGLELSWRPPVYLLGGLLGGTLVGAVIAVLLHVVVSVVVVVMPMLMVVIVAHGVSSRGRRL